MHLIPLTYGTASLSPNDLKLLRTLTFAYNWAVISLPLPSVLRECLYRIPLARAMIKTHNWKYSFY